MGQKCAAKRTQQAFTIKKANQTPPEIIEEMKDLQQHLHLSLMSYAKIGQFYGLSRHLVFKAITCDVDKETNNNLCNNAIENEKERKKTSIKIHIDKIGDKKKFL